MMRKALKWLTMSMRISPKLFLTGTVSFDVMNIEWNYSYYQPWSDNEWLVDEMIVMQEKTLMAQNKDITMQ